jgi:hypothetical protein
MSNPEKIEPESAEQEFNIDTTQYAGTGEKETIEKWSAFAVRHLKEMRVLRESRILGQENIDWRNVSEHVLVTGAFAGFLAQAARNEGENIDVDLMESAAILHDAGKRLDVEKGVRYDTEKNEGQLENILRGAGYSEEVIKICQSSGKDPAIFLEQEDQDKDLASRSLSQLIMAYVDARTRNVNIVSLEEARDQNKKKVPKDADFYDDWFRFQKKIESIIFQRIKNLKPEDINSGVIEEYLATRQEQ